MNHILSLNHVILANIAVQSSSSWSGEELPAFATQFAVPTLAKHGQGSISGESSVDSMPGSLLDPALRHTPVSVLTADQALQYVIGPGASQFTDNWFDNKE